MSISPTPESHDTAESFWSPAYPRNQIWRTLLGIVIIHAAFFAVTFAVFIVGAKLLGTDPAKILDASTPAEASIFFLTFLGYHIGLWIAVRTLHKRGFRSLFGPALRVNWHHFRRGLLVAIGISIAAVILQFLQPLFLTPITDTPTQQSMALASWALLIVPALGLVLLQIFAEELVFRGYILQQLRARFRSIWIWAILPSLAFGLLHYDPYAYGINAIFYVIHTTVIGIVLAVVTLRTGNIGAAAGLHFGNNAMLVFSGTKGTLDGFSLYLTEMDLTGAQMTLSMLSQTFLVLAAFALWWLFTQRNQPIANTAQAD
ncbi:CPBP family intramembrane metalloprotease [Aliiroseovarius sp. S1339]|uniref:CPBP family intramembrane glutamic endopeptidase n=1 Tax=Aliiroseovarius sp. S1339 TaxID=2936990 RepID=UPI0020BEDB2A|nr:type II CAAX endopeptidase family protein [Aliiroseovarius sp. S1339]MCK8464531.1 CPBP family intramembrane metalloprotease [Aliiroseovarius sp. S1339]